MKERSKHRPDLEVDEVENKKGTNDRDAFESDTQVHSVGVSNSEWRDVAQLIGCSFHPRPQDSKSSFHCSIAS